MKDGKWTYQDFVTRIMALEGEVKQLKNQLIDRDLASSQHRRALINCLEALEAGLTGSPYNFDARERGAWTGVRNNPAVWDQIKQLPY